MVVAAWVSQGCETRAGCTARIRCATTAAKYRHGLRFRASGGQATDNIDYLSRFRPLTSGSVDRASISYSPMTLLAIADGGPLYPLGSSSWFRLMAAIVLFVPDVQPISGEEIEAP